MKELGLHKNKILFKMRQILALNQDLTREVDQPAEAGGQEHGEGTNSGRELPRKECVRAVPAIRSPEPETHA